MYCLVLVTKLFVAAHLKCWSDELAQAVLCRHKFNQTQKTGTGVAEISEYPLQLGMQQPMQPVLRKQYSTG